MMVNAIELTEFLEEITSLFEDRLKFYKFYYAEVAVNIDALESRGGVLLECLDLGAKDLLSYIRADVVHPGRSAVFPKVGDSGFLFFMNGNSEQPKFLQGFSAGLAGTKPLQTTHTVIETASVGSKIDVDELAGGFTVESKSPKGALAPPEPSVLGDKLVSVLDDIMEFLKTNLAETKRLYEMLGSHKHMAPLGPTSPALLPEAVEIPTKVASIPPIVVDIDAKKANYIVPGKLLSPSNKNN